MGGLSMSTPSSTRQVWELSCPTVWGRTHPKVLSKGNIFAYTVIEELGPLPFRDSAKSLLATRWGKSKVFISFFYGSALDVGSSALPIVHEVGFGLNSCSWPQEERRNEVSLDAHETNTKLASDNSQSSATYHVHFINFPDPSPNMHLIQSLAFHKFLLYIDEYPHFYVS